MKKTQKESTPEIQPAPVIAPPSQIAASKERVARRVACQDEVRAFVIKATTSFLENRPNWKELQADAIAMMARHSLEEQTWIIASIDAAAGILFSAVPKLPPLFEIRRPS